MARTRIKICGITSPAQGAEAARLGVDAIGLVFWQGSSRAVTIDRAIEIGAALPPFVTPVALFLDPAAEEVEAVIEALPAVTLQFHGNEAPTFCDQFKRPWIKALGMESNADCKEFARAYSRAAGILVDAHGQGQAGGSGRLFDWQRVPGERDFALILAGGLTPANVGAAVRQVRPEAVDVSSGVEGTKGCKDGQLMREFIEEVQRGDRDDEYEGRQHG